MKTVLRPMLVAFVLVTTMLSCNKDEAFVASVANTPSTTTPTDSTGTTPPADTGTPTVSTTPCSFTLANVQSGDTVVIDCVLDLQGQTVTLPSNVTLTYEGGDIINGILNFADNSVISGELLNATLTLSGSTPQLKDPVFTFDPQRWGIVEVEDPNNPQPPSAAIALQNQVILQKTLDLVLDLGVTTFSIDRLNAFFDSKPLYDYWVNLEPIMTIPSNFHLKMSDNTFIRIYPTDSDRSAMAFKMNNISNSKVSGGHIIGERLEHGPTEGGSSLFFITGCRNITVDNVAISLASGSGLSINSISSKGNPNYIPSDNILITNCTFDSNRMNNLEVTDGQNITFENNKSYRAGITMDGKFGLSQGLAPRIGIIVEADEIQFIENVFIRNNIVDDTRSSAGNSILSAGARNVFMSGNTTDGVIGWTSTTNCQITNNVCGGGIIAGFYYENARSKGTDYVISGNTIKNANTGISLTNDKISVFDNTIIDCKLGIMCRGLLDSEIYNNNITSNVKDAFGINGQFYGNNVTIRNNTISLKNSNSRALYWPGVNEQEQYKDNHIYIIDNNIYGTLTSAFTNGVGYEITGNSFTGSGFGFTNIKNTTVTNNSIISEFGNCFGINKTTSSTNIIIKDNIMQNNNSTRLGAYGVIINSVGSSATNENANIILQGNSIKVKGYNYGLHSTNFNGMTIIGNTIESTDLESIYFRGDNSMIKDNQTTASVNILGNNNVVSNN